MSSGPAAWFDPVGLVGFMVFCAVQAVMWFVERRRSCGSSDG